MIDRDDIARAARTSDALAEEIGLEAALARNGIDTAGLAYVAEQRAMRICLIMEGRLAELNPSTPTPVELGWTSPLQSAFASCWMDAFQAGRVSRHDDSLDIAGIAPRDLAALSERLNEEGFARDNPEVTDTRPLTTADVADLLSLTKED